MVGIGGFGSGLLRQLIEKGPDHGVRVVAAVDPQPARAPASADLLASAGIPCHADCRELPGAPAVELAVIASPIAFHAEQSCLLLSRGVHVLCEKPAAATLADGRAMAAAAKAAGRQCAIGFQWSYTDITRRLKALLASGSLGAPRSIAVMALWPRGRSYYRRNGWAGRRHDAAGRAVFDDPVMNATAHYLHHALFLLGDGPHAAAWPVSLEAELYRAHDIETFDAAALRARTAGGVTIRYLAAHCCRKELGPLYTIRCDEAEITYTWREGRGGFVVRRPDGSCEALGDPEMQTQGKLWRTAAAVRDGTPVDCPIEAALPHLAASEGLRQLPVKAIPPAALSECASGDDSIPVPEGIDEVFLDAHKRGILPHETGRVSWTVPAVAADMSRI